MITRMNPSSKLEAALDSTGLNQEQKDGQLKDIHVEFIPA